MAINKVIYGNDTLIDLTDSTVNPTNLLAGEKAYGADGEPVFGTLELGSTINITAIDSEFFGENVTLSDGVTTLITAFDNQGEATFSSVILTGLLTITCKGLSQTISIQTYGTYNVTFDPVPEGATITPVNSIPIWLRCAHIIDKNYTTLAEVLADRETFDILLRDSNACDYMARSTEWALAEGLVPTMTSNTTPSGVASASGIYSSAYDAYKAFDNDDATTWVSNSSTNQWLIYHFPEAKVVRKIRLGYSTGNGRWNGWQFKGSHDGITWSEPLVSGTTGFDVGTVFSFDNDIAYGYYGIFIDSVQSATLTRASCFAQFYENIDITTNQDAMALLGKYDYACNALLGNDVWAEAIANSDYWESVCNGSVPKMSSNTTPEGECFSGSNYSASYPPYLAFDRNTSTVWFWGAVGTNNNHVGYKFPSARKVYAMKAVFSKEGNPTNITLNIQGSVDGTSNYITLASFDTSSWVVGDNEVFVLIENPSNYLSYRILANGVMLQGSGLGFTPKEIQFYGRASKEVFVPLVPTMTSDTTPSGECFSSYDNSNAYLVFDGNDSTTFMGSASTATQSFGYNFGEPVFVNKATHLSQSGYGTTNPKIKLQYSDDKNTWQDASEPVSFGASANVLTTIIGNINTPHRYWRVYLYGDSGVSSWNTYTVQFYQRTVQTNIIHSAANDTIYYLDENEEPVVIATTNSDGDGICDFSLLEDKIYRLYSTVAKDPDNLSNPYSKRVRITKSEFGGTTELYLMPDAVKTLYWWGYESDNLEDLTSANGWTISGGYTFRAPTHNTNSITMTGGSGQFSGVATKTSVTVTKAYVYSNGAWLVESASKTSSLSPRSTGANVINLEFNGTGYFWTGASPGPNILYAFWYE